MKSSKDFFLSNKEAAQWATLSELTTELNHAGHDLAEKAEEMSYWSPDTIIKLASERWSAQGITESPALGDVFDDMVRDSCLMTEIAQNNLKRFDRVLAKIIKLRSEIDA